MSGRRFLTVDEICTGCGLTVRLKTAVPRGKEHHALYYRQAVGAYDCPRCQQRKRVAQCSCSMCKAVRA